MAVGTGRPERCVWRELGSSARDFGVPLGPGGGDRGRGGGSAKLRLSPAARSGEAGPLAGTAGGGTREQRRPAAGCSHGKTHRGAGAGAAGEGRRAPASLATLATLGGPPGWGCSRTPPRSAPRRRRGGPGKQKMLGGKGRPADREPEASWFRVLPARLSAGRGGWPGRRTPGTRGAAHRHLAAAAAGGGWPIGGAHRPRQWRGCVCGGSHASAYTRSLTRTCG